MPVDREEVEWVMCHQPTLTEAQGGPAGGHGAADGDHGGGTAGQIRIFTEMSAIFCYIYIYILLKFTISKCQLSGVFFSSSVM